MARPRTKKTRPVVNVGIDPALHGEFRALSDRFGLKVKAVVPLLWDGWQMLTPEQRTAIALRRIQSEPAKTSAA